MKLSVIMTTYNQARYIAQAIDSVLMQKVDFDFELIIIEDCSTDGTREIVIDYHRRNPELIRLVLAEKNRNDSRNFAREVETCRSQYIAWLEGDDYWTSPHKLQKQADFLDCRPECVICFHNVTKLHEDGSIPPRSYNPEKQESVLELEDILEQNIIATCSVVFRAGMIGRFPEWYFTLPFGDWPVHILNSKFGKIGYIDEIMGVYRIHAAGLWTKLSQVRKNEQIIGFYEVLRANLDTRYDLLLRKFISQRYYDLSVAYEKQGDLYNAGHFLRKSLAEHPTGLVDYLSVNGKSDAAVRIRLRAKQFVYHYPPLYRTVRRALDFLSA
jgi:glycosyltransferase involved in cell wall biosynthesis